MPGTELRERIRAQAFARRSPPEAARLAQEIVRCGEGNVMAVLFFGSRKTGARPGIGSAYDFFVVTGASYRAFYQSLRASRALRRSPAVVAALNALMPPNQISIRLHDPSEGDLHAKCAVVSLKAFLRETSPSRRDHFFLGRLFQPVEVLYAADAAGERVLDALESANRLTFSWVRPRLPRPFDVVAYCRALFEVSFAAEIRPEPSERIQTLWQAQKDELRETYGLLLQDLAAQGALLPAGEGLFTLRVPTSRREKLRLFFYFRWSKVRATARWAKYIVTFDDWLEFILRKAERHTGRPIVLTPRERRMPLIFLWPRFFRYLRHKDKSL